ncbi:hypothetical protein SDC9_168525 [bioreactor metagenome]|uniref:Uncharacterized protein n=1 Tax=bioreactor metagenome TaxID=1076179 RepID=A0A645G4T1_9ZZZZ
MDTVAVRVPTAEGAKVISKVVLEPAVIGVDGTAVTLKSSAFAPLTATSGEPVSVKSAVPVFWIVNVRVTVSEAAAAEPKSVLSVKDGVVSPLVIAVPLP